MAAQNFNFAQKFPQIADFRITFSERLKSRGGVQLSLALCHDATANWAACLKWGFHPTQRTQRKNRNEMTSLLDRPITAASDDGVCRWQATKLWQTRHKI